MAKPTEFPKYLMIINGNLKFLSLRDAAEVNDSGFGRIEFGKLVLSENFTVSEMSDEHKALIRSFGDRLHVKK